MNLRINHDLVETLIGLHESYILLVYPDGFSGTFEFGKDDQTQEPFKRHSSDPNRLKFIEIVESLDTDARVILIALMFLGREKDSSVDDFPAMLEQARRVQGDNDSEYLFSKAEMSRFLREGMAKLDLGHSSSNCGV